MQILSWIVSVCLLALFFENRLKLIIYSKSFAMNCWHMSCSIYFLYNCAGFDIKHLSKHLQQCRVYTFDITVD